MWCCRGVSPLVALTAALHGLLPVFTTPRKAWHLAPALHLATPGTSGSTDADCSAGQHPIMEPSTAGDPLFQPGLLTPCFTSRCSFTFPLWMKRRFYNKTDKPSDGK